jgi:signal transduction histidine kinase
MKTALNRIDENSSNDLSDIIHDLIEIIRFIQFTEKVSVKLYTKIDEDEIYNTVIEEFNKSKKHSATILLLTNDQSKLGITGTSEKLRKLKPLEKVTGIKIKGFKIPLKKSKISGQVINEGKTLHFKVTDFIRELFPRPLAALISKTMGYEEKMGIATPLTKHGKIIGTLTIISPFLFEYFIPLVKNPARHISTALELADEHNDLKKITKKIKQQNIKLKKLDKIKSNFLNVTSHELRAPMASIKGYAQMMLRKKLGEISDEQKKALDVILRNANRLDNLVQDILDISRLESGTMKFIIEKTDIQKLVDEVTETMQSPSDLKDIKINIEVEEKLPSLNIDQDRIKQVIMNLVNNAIKFSPDGSIINVATRKEKDDILFEVQDFGRGIPKDKQDKVFETFYQVDSGTDIKFGGAGLGLAISRGIVIAHGGNIWVESEGISGKGSTFKFTLPVKSVKDIEERFKAIDMFGLKE